MTKKVSADIAASLKIPTKTLRGLPLYERIYALLCNHSAELVGQSGARTPEQLDRWVGAFEKTREGKLLRYLQRRFQRYHDKHPNYDETALKFQDTTNEFFGRVQVSVRNLVPGVRSRTVH